MSKRVVSHIQRRTYCLPTRKKTTLHGGQSRSWSAEQVKKKKVEVGIDPKCWMRAAQDAPEWYRKVETGAEVFMSAWSTKRVNETNDRHAKELFATLPFELP